MKLILEDFYLRKVELVSLYYDSFIYLAQLINVKVDLFLSF